VGRGIGHQSDRNRAEPALCPDDRIVYSGGVNGTYSVIKGQADQMALHYARTENRLLLGHRNGDGIQVLPEVLPAEPLGPLFIRLNGCTAAFRVNGTTFNIDSQGVTATTDALFWGAIDGTVADAWFPVPPGALSLPSAVAVTTNASPTPANAIAIPSGFNPSSPNLATLFASLPINQAPVFAKTVTPGVLLRPYSETVDLAAGSGSGALATAYPWINQPATDLFAGSGSGAFAIKGLITTALAGSGSGVITDLPSGPNPYTFTGGSTQTFAGIKGWMFTVSSSKVIQGLGFYDHQQNGLSGSYEIWLEELVNPANTGAGAYGIALTANGQTDFVTVNNSSTLSGVWRTANLPTTGATLAPNKTYLLMAALMSGTADAIIKNATSVTLPANVNYVQNLDPYVTGFTTAADGIGYFGPMIFFQ
jgi:hypothetical protein